MEKIVINVRTQKEYDELMEIYENKGWFWNDWAEPALYKNWDTYKENTCVRYEDIFWYADIDFFKDMWYKILTFKEFKDMENKETFKKGEIVEARADYNEEWEKRIYLTTIEWAKYPYTVVDEYYEDDFNNWKPFEITWFKQIRKLNSIPEYTMEQLQKKLWEEFKIIK